jgi:purine-nucleoside phosphorylase
MPIVRPVVSARTPVIGERGVVIAGVRPDLDRMRKDLGRGDVQGFPVASSRLFPGDTAADGALAGPVLGAPHAAILMECLIAWGARRIIFWGWCGAVTGELDIGDVLMPDAAVSDEGTSRHYAHTGTGDMIQRPNPADAVLVDALAAEGISVNPRPVWSTDAIFRETPAKIAFFRDLGATAVDMETSAMFAIARMLGVSLTVLLVVSDSVAGSEWVRGFRHPRFLERREMVSRCLARVMNGQS